MSITWNSKYTSRFTEIKGYWAIGIICYKFALHSVEAYHTVTWPLSFWAGWQHFSKSVSTVTLKFWGTSLCHLGMAIWIVVMLVNSYVIRYWQCKVSLGIQPQFFYQLSKHQAMNCLYQRDRTLALWGQSRSDSVESMKLILCLAVVAPLLVLGKPLESVSNTKYALLK